MAKESFSERFNRLTEHMSDADLGSAMGLGWNGVRKLRLGTTQSIKLDAALRLCRKLGVSPWYLGGEPDPIRPLDQMSPAEAAAFNDATRPGDPHRSLEAKVDLLGQRLAALNERVARLDQEISAEVRPHLSGKRARRGKTG